MDVIVPLELLRKGEGCEFPGVVGTGDGLRQKVTGPRAYAEHQTCTNATGRHVEMSATCRHGRVKLSDGVVGSDE